MGAQLVRELCPDCRRAFVDGYMQGCSDESNQHYPSPTDPVRCEHGDVDLLCPACIDATDEVKARHLATRDAILAKVRAACSVCPGCGELRDTSRPGKLCSRCAEIWAEHTAEFIAKNPPPMLPSQMSRAEFVSANPPPVAKGDGPMPKMPRSPTPLTPCCNASVRFVPTMSEVTGESGVKPVCDKCLCTVNFHDWITGGTHGV